MGERIRVSYEVEMAWADRFLPTMKRIIGPHLLEPSPFEIDTKQAADLVVLRARNITIACRVRRLRYLAAFGDQFTIRYALESGYETEHSKIIKGWADWMFYAFAASDSDYRIDFAKWTLLDLSAFRAHLIIDHKRQHVKAEKKWNNDGTALIAYRISSFSGDPSLVIAQSDRIQPQINSREGLSANG